MENVRDVIGKLQAIGFTLSDIRSIVAKKVDPESIIKAAGENREQTLNYVRNMICEDEEVPGLIRAAGRREH